MFRRLWLLVFVACAPQPSFDEGTCPFKVHGSQTVGTTVRCGTLRVAEEHGKIGSRVIDVPVLVFKASTTVLPPIVNLSGGPGQSWRDLGLEELSSEATRSLDRDVIFIEQRGAGIATPNLACPGQKSNELTQDYVTSCLQMIDAPLAAYNTEELAHDVADLREVLGYDQLLLDGVSYGTAWAQEVMRQHPEILAGVVLDSSLSSATPPLAQMATAQDDAFAALFRECENEPECQSAFGDLEEKMLATLAALEKKPLSTPPKGKLTAADFYQLVAGTLRAEPSMTPLAIDTVFHALADGKIDIERRNSFPGTDKIAIGQYLSIMCSDNQHVTREMIAADRERVRPELRPYVRDGAELLALCDSWPYKRRPQSAFAAVTSDVPTLVLAGALDFVTPPKWGREVASALPRGAMVEVPGVGHHVASYGSGCVRGIRQAFYRSPSAPDIACVGRMSPGFATPDASRDAPPRLVLRAPSLIPSW